MSVLIRYSLVLAFMASSWLFADEPPTNTPELQGVWSLVEIVDGGRTLSPESYKKLQLRVTFTKNRMTISSPHVKTVNRYTITTDSSKNPPWIDFTPIDGPYKGKTALSIYELRKDHLKVCMSQRPGQERPTEFELPRNSHMDVYVLKRQE